MVVCEVATSGDQNSTAISRQELVVAKTCRLIFGVSMACCCLREDPMRLPHPVAACCCFSELIVFVLIRFSFAASSLWSSVSSFGLGETASKIFGVVKPNPEQSEGLVPSLWPAR